MDALASQRLVFRIVKCHIQKIKQLPYKDNTFDYTNITPTVMREPLQNNHQLASFSEFEYPYKHVIRCASLFSLSPQVGNNILKAAMDRA